MSAFELGGDTGGAEGRIPGGRNVCYPLHGLLIALSRLGEVGFDGLLVEGRHLLEVGCGDFVGLKRKTEFRQAIERGGKMIDRVVGHGHGAMAALIPNFEADFDHVFFADLDVVGDFLASGLFSPASFVDAEFGVDQVAMGLDQPVDTVIGPAAFFIGGERHDQVAVRFEAFLLIADQIGDPDGGLGLVVTGAPAIEKPSFSMNWKGSIDQSSRLASTTSVWAKRRIGLRAPVPR